MFKMDRIEENIQKLTLRNLLKDSFFQIYLILILIIYTWFITDGTFNLFAITEYGNYLTKSHINGFAYDSLAKSISKGKFDIDPSSILFEAFIIKGKAYMYFGLLPAIPRIMLNTLFPEMYGHWSRTFCLLMAIATIFAFSSITIQKLNENEFLSIREKKQYLYLFFISFGLGTPILFLMTNSMIYHEAILWALCFSVWSIYYINKILTGKDVDKLTLIKFSACAGLALLSKPSFAVPLYIIILILASKIFLIDKKKKILLISLIIPAAIFLALQLLYNYGRFGSIFTFSERKYYLLTKTVYMPEETFQISRFFISFQNYFLPRSGVFINKVLCIQMPYITVPDRSAYYIDHSSRTLPLCYGSPWIILGTIIGILLLLLRSGLLEKLIALSCLVNSLLVLSLFHITQRHACEFLIVMTFAYGFYIKKLGDKKFFLLGKRSIYMLNIMVCIFSIFVTLLCNIEYIYNLNVSKRMKSQIRELFFIKE